MMMSAFLLFALSGMAEATVGSKQIKVDYNNIVIYADGKAVNLSAGQEPFLLNGVTYVPLRVAGEALKCNVNWQAETKTIQLTSGAAAEVGSLKAQLIAKDQEIANLKKQIEDLQKQPDKEDKNDLRDLEDELLDRFDELEDVAIEDIRLDGDEDDVEVEIEVDLGDYGDEWEDLRDKDIEDWLEDLVEYIQDELTKNTVIEGVVIDIDDDEELVEFNKDGKDDLEVDFNDEDYRGGSDNASEVEDNLLNKRYSVEDLEFRVTQVNYDKDDKEVDIHLDAEDDDCSVEWRYLRDRDIEDAVDSIGEDIAEEFEDENVRLDTVELYFYDEDGFELESFKYNV